MVWVCVSDLSRPPTSEAKGGIWARRLGPALPVPGGHLAKDPEELGGEVL